MLQLEAHLNQPCVGVSGSFNLSLGLTVTPGSGSGGMPIHACVLLDLSGSMAGPRFEHAKDAIRTVWRGLAPHDTLTLVSFATDTREVMPRRARGQGADGVLEAALNGLTPEGVTRLDLGIPAAVRALASAPTGEPRRIWLVTDGHPTNARGAALDDTSELIGLAASTASHGISLGALGLGDASNYRAPFLTELADRGQGTFCYAPDPAGLATQLQDELQSAQNVAAVDARIHVAFHQGVGLLACERVIPEYRPHDFERGASGFTISVGDFPRPSSTYLLELQLAAPLGQPPGQRVFGEASVEGTLRGTRVTSPSVALRVEHQPRGSRQLSARHDHIENLRINLMLQRNLELRSRATDPADKVRLTQDAIDAARRTGNLPLASELEAQVQALLAGGALTADQDARTVKDARTSGRLPQFAAPKAQP